jgi:predicted XRE-type DNA-binding protein
MKRKTFDNVWDAIEPSAADAASMKARAQMMIVIRETVEAWDVTQAVAAKRLGVTQPRMNDLIRAQGGKEFKAERGEAETGRGEEETCKTGQVQRKQGQRQQDAVGTTQSSES